jgi:iron(III) transport system permease protein
MMSQKRRKGNEVKVKKRTFTSFAKQSWTRCWQGNPPDAALLLLGAAIAAVMSVPILYVVVRSVFAGTDRWARLLDNRIPLLLSNTLLLALGVTLAGLIVGISLAWLVNRCDLPGRKYWYWLLALPLVIPPYVGAVTYIIIFGPRGWFRDVFGSSPVNMYSFGGVLFVLTAFTYPYVFLIAGSAMKRMNRSFEDVARSMGMGSMEIFRKVNLPFLRPAIGAGMILIALYVLSDFGAVAMLRYTTFTSAIYYQMGSYDNLSATVLSVILIAVTLAILWLEGRTRRKLKYFQTANTYNKPDLLPLGCWKIPALVYVFLVFCLSVALPVTVLLWWTRQGIAAGALNHRFWLYTLNSLKVAGLAAAVAMFFALPVIYLKSRYPSVISVLIDKLSYSGYALPGVIVALGIIFIFNQYIPSLYNTFYLVAAAYVIRFLPQAMQSGEASLSLISPRVDEAARSLGYAPWKVLLNVIVPLVLPGIFAGGALVFVSSLKELPATLLLRPPGFDTLAVRIWVESSEAVYHMAAPAALLVILISILPLRWMLNKY